MIPVAEHESCCHTLSRLSGIGWIPAMLLTMLIRGSGISIFIVWNVDFKRRQQQRMRPYIRAPYAQILFNSRLLSSDAFQEIASILNLSKGSVASLADDRKWDEDVAPKPYRCLTFVVSQTAWRARRELVPIRILPSDAI